MTSLGLCLPVLSENYQFIKVYCSLLSVWLGYINLTFNNKNVFVNKVVIHDCMWIPLAGSVTAAACVCVTLKCQIVVVCDTSVFFSRTFPDFSEQSGCSSSSWWTRDKTWCLVSQGNVRCWVAIP